MNISGNKVKVPMEESNQNLDERWFLTYILNTNFKQISTFYDSKCEEVCLFVLLSQQKQIDQNSTVRFRQSSVCKPNSIFIAEYYRNTFL